MKHRVTHNQARPNRMNAQAWPVLVAWLLAASLSATGCDTKKDTFSDPVGTLFCETIAQCPNGRNTAFGLLGDSWTDLALGQQAIKDLRDFMEDDYGFRLTGATVAGQRLSVVLGGGIHLEVIRRGGPSMRWMVVSLGGNDMIFNSTQFVANPAAERERVLASIERDLLQLVRTGNAYKQAIYGGQPLVWFWHGYDYGNPDNLFITTSFSSDVGCRARLKSSGYSDALIDNELPRNLDAFQDMLVRATQQEPTLRRIDLRRTLGGPPVSDRSLMFDCIHPTALGFGALAAGLVTAIDAATGGAR